jgi:hypothetical protein
VFTYADLTAKLRAAADSVQDGIAKEGLIVLKRVLDQAGFIKSSYLKDYEVYAYVGGEGVTFEILLSLDAVDIDLDKMKDAAAEAAEALEKSSKRIYKVIQRGGFNRVAQMRDIRRPVPSALNRPRRTKSNLKQWGRNSSKYGPRSAFKGPQQRELDHDLALSAPRDMHINREGRLSLTFGQQTRTTKSGEIHFPQGKFQGIMKQFMDELQNVIADHFIPELEKMMAGWVK